MQRSSVVFVMHSKKGRKKSLIIGFEVLNAWSIFVDMRESFLNLRHIILVDGVFDGFLFDLKMRFRFYIEKSIKKNVWTVSSVSYYFSGSRKTIGRKYSENLHVRFIPVEMKWLKCHLEFQVKDFETNFTTIKQPTWINAWASHAIVFKMIDGNN